MPCPRSRDGQAILDEARVYIPTLQAKLAVVSGIAPEAARLAMALAAVKGSVWEALAPDPAVLDSPATELTLARVFTAALGNVTPAHPDPSRTTA